MKLVEDRGLNLLPTCFAKSVTSGKKLDLTPSSLLHKCLEEREKCKVAKK
jgi:hypothetical protein